jgi:hypothetical protein
MEVIQLLIAILQSVEVGADTLVRQALAEALEAEALVGLDILQALVHQGKGMQAETDIGHLLETTEFLVEVEVLEVKGPYLHRALR